MSEAEAFDEERELCADGNCLGVVVDGKCNVCGLGAGASPPDPAIDEEVAPLHAGAADQGGAPASAAGPTDLLADEDRRLCPDGACIGLLDSDGKCKECGRSAAS